MHLKRAPTTRAVIEALVAGVLVPVAAVVVIAFSVMCADVLEVG